MRTIQTQSFFVLILSLTLFATGCTRDLYTVDPLITTADADGITNNQINPYTYVDPADKGKKKTLYEQAVDAKDGDNARDRLQTTLMRLSDEVTAQHLAGILGFEDTLNIGFGATALTLDALAASMTPPGTKTALSAFSGAVTGTRSLTNDELYHNAFGPAIVRAIIQDRRRFAEDIYKRRKEEKGVTYTIEDALKDAIEYHNRGSFYYGLTLVQKEVYRQIEDKEQKTDGIQEENGRKARAAIESRTSVSEMIEKIKDAKLKTAVYDLAAKLIDADPKVTGFDAAYKADIAAGLTHPAAFSKTSSDTNVVPKGLEEEINTYLKTAFERLANPDGTAKN